MGNITINENTIVWTVIILSLSVYLIMIKHFAKKKIAMSKQYKSISKYCTFAIYSFIIIALLFLLMIINLTGLALISTSIIAFYNYKLDLKQQSKKIQLFDERLWWYIIMFASGSFLLSQDIVNPHLIQYISTFIHS